MRTVVDETITQALINTQSDANKTPYIRIYINSVDYSARLLYLEHHEEAYRERAVIGLSNRDGTLDAIDLDGKEFEIGYGYDSSGYVGGSVTDYVPTATLWVKSHQVLSIRGERVYQIYAEGMWSRLSTEKVIPGLSAWKASKAYKLNQSVQPVVPNGHIYLCTVAGTSGIAQPTFPTTSGGTVVDNTVTWTEDGVSNPYYNVFLATHTVEELIQSIIESMGWTWTAVGSSDGIIDVYPPTLSISLMGYETGAAVIYRLIWMTKEYLRTKPSKTFEAVYPQSIDLADKTYYSASHPYFDEYNEVSKLLEPNSILVLCNQDPTGAWNTADYTLITGVASDAAQIAKYVEIVEPFIAGNIRTQPYATSRAEAILTRLKAEMLGGRAVLPFHDCQVELYDKLSFVDTRIGSTTFPSDSMTRVTGLIHRYNRDQRQYNLEIVLGDTTTEFGLPNWADNPYVVPTELEKPVPVEPIKEVTSSVFRSEPSDKPGYRKVFIHGPTPTPDQVMPPFLGITPPVVHPPNLRLPLSTAHPELPKSVEPRTFTTMPPVVHPKPGTIFDTMSDFIRSLITKPRGGKRP